MLNLNYVAGIIDGEGYVGIIPNARDYRSFVGIISVSMATPFLVRKLHKQYGGSLRTDPRPGVHQRDAQIWAIKGRKAALLASWLKYYCLLKKKQLLNVVKLYEIKDRAPVRNHPSEHLMKLQKNLWAKNKLLNKRGK
jgi:hypothetical protein